tara:strand:- start:484 stop:864 length:381 start_codon:yes stop_codon:yes gene_type:complete
MAQIIINTMILKNGFGVEFDVGYVGNVDGPHLFLVYGVGVFFIWLILGLMYFHAYNKRDILELDKNELSITTNSIIANFIVSFVAMLSIIMIFLKIEHSPGWLYFSISPLIFIAIFIKEKYFTLDK